MPLPFLIPALLLAWLNIPGFVSAQRAVLRAVGEKPNRRPVAFPIRAQLREEVVRQDGIAVLSAFALLHPDSHARSIDVYDLEFHQLAHSESGRVGGHQ